MTKPKRKYRCFDEDRGTKGWAEAATPKKAAEVYAQELWINGAPAIERLIRVETIDKSFLFSVDPFVTYESFARSPSFDQCDDYKHESSGKEECDVD